MSARSLSRGLERFRALSVLWFTVAASVVSAQSIGTLTGQLADQTGGALSGVEVVMTNTEDGHITIVVTDMAGRYRVNLDPGKYHVHFKVANFAPVDMRDVRVTAGVVAELVQVTAKSALPFKTLPVTNVQEMTSDEILGLPKSRTFLSLALMAPSVNAGDLEGGLQIAGASSAENAFTIDGINVNSLINGALRQAIAADFLDGLQVRTTGSLAESAGAPGGVISAVLKSGGDTLRGEAHYNVSGSSLSAGPVNRLVLNPADNTTVGYVQDHKPPNQRRELGGSIGGPVIKRHLWFYGATSPTFERRKNTYLFSSGTERGQIQRKQRSTQALGKITFEAGRLKGNVAMLRTSGHATGSLPVFNGFGPNVISSSKAANEPNQTRGFKSNQLSSEANVTLLIGAATTLTFRGSYFRDTYRDSGIPRLTSYTYQTPSSRSPLPVPSNLAGPAGTQNTPQLLQTLFDTTRRVTSSVDYSNNFEARGFHLLKTGVAFQRAMNLVNSSFPGGYVNVFWGSSLVNSNGLTDSGAYGYYEVNDVGLKGSAGADTYSFFAQDQWRLKRLSLNVGVRSQRETVPSFRPDIERAAATFGLSKTAAPKLSVVYDAHGDGSLTLFTGWDRTYDWTKYEVARDLFGGKIWRTYYRAIDDPNVLPSVSLNNMPGRNIWQGPNEFRDNLTLHFDVIDPTIKPMLQDSLSAGIELRMSAHSIVSVRFAHNNLRRTIEDVMAQVDGKTVYVLGNPGEGRASVTAPSGLTAAFSMPKPRRQYDALELNWRRHLSGNWFTGANYTLSRLYGNYAGLANSDEIRTPTIGGFSAAQQDSTQIAREGGNLNNAWDIDEVMWDSHGHLDVLGRLATDRPHVLKLFGSYTFSEHTTAGCFFYGASGTPLSTYLVTAHHSYVFVEGRGDMGRTPLLTQTDVVMSHDLKMNRNKTLRIELDVMNLFNQKTARHRFNFYNRGGGLFVAGSAVSLATIDLANGYTYRTLVGATPNAATIGATDPRYGKNDLFNPPLQAYVTAKFIF